MRRFIHIVLNFLRKLRNSMRYPDGSFNSAGIFSITNDWRTIGKNIGERSEGGFASSGKHFMPQLSPEGTLFVTPRKMSRLFR